MRFLIKATGTVVETKNEAVIEMMAASDAYETVKETKTEPVATVPETEPTPEAPKPARTTRKSKASK